jgi:putative ABC transport system permease protein
MLLASSKSDFAKIKNEFQSSVQKVEFPIEGFKNIETHARTILDLFIGVIYHDKTSFYASLSALLLIIFAIPSLNLINLNITRIRERESEIGIRKSFGSPVTLIAWQFLIENIVLTLLGGLLALVFSLVILKSIQSTGVIPFDGIPFNFRIFLNAILFCLLFGLISGLLPALRMSRLQIVKTLHGGLS